MLEFIKENMLVLCLVGGAAASTAWLWILRERLGIKKLPVIIALAIVHTLVGVVSVKLFAGLESLSNPLDGGMSLFGAVFILPIFYALGSKIFSRNPRDVFDVFTFCVVSTLLIVRLNCINNGCCVGKLIPGSDTLRFFTREAEMVFHAAVLIILFARIKKEKAIKGDTFPLYMMLYGTFRFIEEFFRAGGSGVLHIAHIWAVLSIVIGSAVYFELHARTRGKTKQKN